MIVIFVNLYELTPILARLGFSPLFEKRGEKPRIFGARGEY